MISVIVPYWNADKWIGRCTDSLMKQTGDFEFILVDDMSDDAPAFEHDERFILTENRHSKGVSGARNTGIDMAHGEWVTFLDADDEMLPDAYKAFMETIKGDQKAVMHQMNHVRYYTKINKTAMKYTNRPGRYTVTNLPDIWWSVWNKLYKREFIQGIRFQEGMQYGEDGLFNLECLAKGAYIHHGVLKTVAVKHRFDNKESLSHVKHAEDIIRQIRAYEEFLFRQDDVKMRRLMCKELAKLWSNERALSLIGGEDV